MAQWLGILHRDLRPRKPSSKPLLQEAIARNLVRDYGLSPREAEKFSRSERKIIIKRPAIRLPIRKGFELGKKVILKSIPRPRRYDRKVGVKTIQRVRKLEKLRQRLRQSFRPVPVPIVPKKLGSYVPRLGRRRTHLRVTRRVR